MTIEANERSNRVIKVTINQSIGEILFDVIGAGTCTFHANRASRTNREYAEFHGWKQRLVDDAAGVKDPAAKLSAIKGLVDFYEAGGSVWSSRSDVARESEVSLLIRGLIAAGLMQDTDEKRAKVRAMNATERTALAMHPKVKVEIDKIRETLTAGVDTDALIAGI